MNVTIITYDTSHAKTADIFFLLRSKENVCINFLLAPFVPRPERDVVLRHRPNQFVGPRIRHIAEYYGLKVWDYDEREIAVKDSDYLIVGGANILEPELANCGKIINGHAGIIPLIRGLDAFKWAIHNLDPIGNTLHFIDEHADSGSVIHQEITPLFSNDTIESFAERHYRMEICILGSFTEYLNHGKKLAYSPTEPRKRMPMEIERQMLTTFPRYKEKYAFTSAL